MFTNTRNTWQLRVRDPDGAERQLLERRTELLFPTFSPDGRRVAFFGRAGYAVAIFTIGIDGSDLRQLTAGEELNHHPRWSADGEHVVFYQIKPELSLRRVPAFGGASTAVLPWNWERENAMQYGPAGRSIVFTRSRLPGAPRTEPESTVVHDVTTGQQRELPPPHLHYCHFSPDGRWISGSRDDGSIVVCAADGRACHTVATAIPGSPNAWSGNSARLYFLRAAARPRGHHDLWSVGADGSGERLEGTIGAFLPIDIFFDVSADDRIVWAASQQGRRELWTAALQ
jgi:hypothetical protein